MPPIPADRFLERVLGDEGWQSTLSGDSIEAVIARLETLLPPEATVEEAQGERLRASLRELAELVALLEGGQLDQARLVAGWLRHTHADG